jgi:periplasmic copper chaperone A
MTRYPAFAPVAPLAIRADRLSSPSDARADFSKLIHRLLEDIMRYLLKFLVTVALMAGTIPAFAQSSSIQVDNPFARATPAGASTGAVYMTISNKSNAADRLTGASSEVADKLQIHEMKMVNGVMQMRELPSGLALPPGRSVALKPGSYHVMLIGLKQPLKAGETFPLTLTFEKAGKVEITVPVQSVAGMQSDTPGMGHMDMK